MNESLQVEPLHVPPLKDLTSKSKKDKLHGEIFNGGFSPRQVISRLLPVIIIPLCFP